MIYLNLLELILDFLQIYIFEGIIEVSSHFWKFRDFVMFEHRGGLYLSTAIDTISNYLIQLITVPGLKYMRGGFYIYREIVAARFILGYFPNINPYRGAWSLLTEPVDIFLRPLHKWLPKLPYLDLAGWVLFFMLDTSIKLIDFLIKTATSVNLTN
jgi:uncharacterized protein YggT (Ycf19 family)